MNNKLLTTTCLIIAKSLIVVMASLLIYMLWNGVAVNSFGVMYLTYLQSLIIATIVAIIIWVAEHLKFEWDCFIHARSCDFCPIPAIVFHFEKDNFELRIGWLFWSLAILA